MPHYNENEIQAANQVDLAAFLFARGEVLKKRGRQLLWERHQVWIDGCRWYSHYEARGGYAIRFVMQYFGLTFQEAIAELLGKGIATESIQPSLPKQEKQLVLPPPNPTMNRIYAYLMQERGIDREVIHHFTHAKMLYEDAQFHNCIFVGYDEAGIARHCHRRSTGGSFKQTEAGSQAEYSFHHDGTSEWLFVFEAPIDMLAFISMHQRDWREHSYVALCSVSERAILHRLEVNPKLTRIVLCLDNDEAGQSAANRIAELLKSRGYTDVRIHRPNRKDWDEDLKLKREVSV